MLLGWKGTGRHPDLSCSSWRAWMRDPRACWLAAGLVVSAVAPVAARAAEPGPAEGIWRRPNLLGDMGGLRSVLDRYGVSLGLTETTEVLGNAAGGVRRGAAYDGLTTLTLDIDTGKRLGWPGGTFHASALQSHGRNLSADNLYTL